MLFFDLNELEPAVFLRTGATIFDSNDGCFFDVDSMITCFGGKDELDVLQYIADFEGQVIGVFVPGVDQCDHCPAQTDINDLFLAYVGLDVEGEGRSIGGFKPKMFASLVPLDSPREKKSNFVLQNLTAGSNKGIF